MINPSAGLNDSDRLRTRVQAQLEQYRGEDRPATLREVPAETAFVIIRACNKGQTTEM